MSGYLNKIADDFNKAGYEIYEVGGMVRDSILGRPSNDIDLCTDAVPEETIRLLKPFGSVYTIGRKFGTVGVLLADETKVEVTTYRTETYSKDSRKPETVFEKSLIKDLCRRDFTINAIARDIKTGELIDPRNGKRDIGNKIIRCTQHRDTTFSDDPLRMMRAVRFEAQLPGFSFVEKIDNPERLEIVSMERIREELDKIMKTDEPHRGIRRLCSLGLMKYIIPELLELKTIPHGKHHFKDPFDHTMLVLQKGAVVSNELSFRYACLFHDIAKPDTISMDETGVHFNNHNIVGAGKAKTIMKRLRFDKKTITTVRTLVNHHMEPLHSQKLLEDATDKRKDYLVGRMVRRIGRENIYDLINLVRCDIRSSKNPKLDFLDILEEAVNNHFIVVPVVKSPLSGNEIMDYLNIKPSQEVGRLKSILVQKVIDGELGFDDKEAAKKLIKEL